jgi:hypothetical protein
MPNLGTKLDAQKRPMFILGLITLSVFSKVPNPAISLDITFFFLHINTQAKSTPSYVSILIL